MSYLEWHEALFRAIIPASFQAFYVHCWDIRWRRRMWTKCGSRNIAVHSPGRPGHDKQRDIA